MELLAVWPHKKPKAKKAGLRKANAERQEIIFQGEFAICS